MTTPLVGSSWRFTGISILGAYVEMDRAATASGSEIDAAIVMLGAGVIIWFPLTGLGLRSGQVARILIAPMLVAGLATCATLLSAGILAILVSVRCNAGENLTLVLIELAAVPSVTVGVAVFLIMITLAVRSARKAKTRQP